MTPLRGDRGGATVAACLALAGLLCATVLVGQVGVVVVARHRAQAAADLGALAGAAALAAGPAEACARAAEPAPWMGAVLRRCVVEQWDVEVSVEVETELGVLGTRTVWGIARAGPVDSG
ncbi:Rv3654c family TadE-like protein [Nocardia thailandica]